MAPPSHSARQTHEYLDALLTAIPNDSIPPEIASPSRGAHRPYLKFIDTALRLASGGSARPDDATPIRDAWPEIQASVQRALHALHPSAPSSSSTQQQGKRKHSPSLPTGTNNKKFKHDDGGDNNEDEDDGDDVPQLTLHALSATAPVRHKIDITLHARTLRLAHSTTGAIVARCARTALTRVFLLPTRARSSGALQWTALLLAGDKPAPPSPRGAGSKEAKAAAAVRFELACSVPDSSKPAAIPRITKHTSTSTSAPASSTREALLAILSPTISDTSITLTTVERGAPLAGITAFRGVRETLLWFLDDSAGAGILADGRPAEFWGVADLAQGEAGVRVRTATGRTCSMVLMRRSGGPGEHDGEDEEEEGEETEFQMIDGKERERILEWVRRHRGAFGIAKVQQGAAAKGKENGKQRKGAGAEEEGEGIDARGAAAAAAGEDSDSDSDFETESGESDGGSPSSGGSGGGSGSGPGSDAGSDAGSEDEHEDESRSGSGGGGSGRDDDDDDEVMMELEPKHHPLLRAGGLPKMSRAAMDAAVELVVGDLVGQTHQDAPGPGPSGLRCSAEDEGDEDEEDELED
ncbi:hypothetical protein DFH94DRAFT_621320 [Russula ochroleuca]|uniref:Histone chaperone RTT106/FACT complex subunit SPT16-like middle domain-containing protein n=1 Tax=Russula ochroleuca TaxID=152965 RepID=A0A9P5TEN0_9AGAM|nr:hypothetical protein DFH94DRAFT_621320 [Russula ochroleuca]